MTSKLEIKCNSDFIYRNPTDIRTDYFRLREAGFPVSQRALKDGRLFLHVPHGFANEVRATLQRPRDPQPDEVFQRVFGSGLI